MMVRLLMCGVVWTRNSVGECFPYKEEVAGSIPAASTIFCCSSNNSKHNMATPELNMEEAVAYLKEKIPSVVP
jgi:hypothetical protein